MDFGTRGGECKIKSSVCSIQGLLGGLGPIEGTVGTLVRNGRSGSAGLWKGKVLSVLSITFLVCVSGRVAVCAGGGVNQAE